MFRKNKVKLLVWFSVVLILSAFLTYRFFMVANEVAGAQAQREATQTVNNIASRYLQENSNLYSNILVKDRSSSGNIASINTDIEKINRLQTEISDAVLRGLATEEGLHVTIPFGNILGLPVLLNVGPSIDCKIAPVSNVHVRFEDSFVSAGINQTKFSVDLIIETEILYSLSAYENKLGITNTIPVVQLVLVGDIPDNYANINR